MPSLVTVGSPTVDANALTPGLVYAGNGSTNVPDIYIFIWTYRVGNYWSQFARSMTGQKEWMRYSNGTNPSGEWTLIPTRAEIDALNSKSTLTTDQPISATNCTDNWLLTAAPAIYHVSGGSAEGSFLEGCGSTFGHLIISTDMHIQGEEYGIIFFNNSNNEMYYRNFYRKKSTSVFLWRGPLRKIATTT